MQDDDTLVVLLEAELQDVLRCQARVEEVAMGRRDVAAVWEKVALGSQKDEVAGGSTLRPALAVGTAQCTRLVANLRMMVDVLARLDISTVPQQVPSVEVADAQLCTDSVEAQSIAAAADVENRMEMASPGSDREDSAQDADNAAVVLQLVAVLLAAVVGPSDGACVDENDDGAGNENVATGSNCSFPGLSPVASLLPCPCSIPPPPSLQVRMDVLALCGKCPYCVSWVPCSCDSSCCFLHVVFDSKSQYARR